MKKLLIFLFGLLICFVGIGQAIQQRSSPTITVADSRWIGLLNMFAPKYADTTAANVQKGIDSAAAIIYTYDCNCIWFRQLNPKKWSHVVTVDGRIDTLFAQLPLFFDSVSRAPSTIIKFRQNNGVIGGVVTIDSCRNISVSAGVVTINFTSFAFAFTTLNVAAADPTFPRQDYVIVDTFGIVSILQGTPASPALPPVYNPSSQFVLASYTIAANASCLPITQTIIYDEHTGSPEWTVTSSGTITENPDNTDNPFHLTKAIFIPTYQNGSTIILTKPSGTQTVSSGEIFKMYGYFNGLFSNQIQAQWFNGATASSNNIVINSYFNINDSNQYQNISIPMTAWTFSNTTFNKLIITFAGNDISGSKGLYLDYIQLQEGFAPQQRLFVDSTKIITGNEYYYINGTPFLAGAVSSGSSGWSLTGNAGITPGTNFIGTTDNEQFEFKVNNTQSGFIGTATTPNIYNLSLGILSRTMAATGNRNTALGSAALGLNTSGDNNTGVGYAPLYHDTTGTGNTGVGWGAIGWNNGDGNTAVGYSSLSNTVSVVHHATYNTAIGFEALQNNTDHFYNIGLGVQAGQPAAQDSTFYISPFTIHMIYGIDSAEGTAPSMIGYDPVTQSWHHYSISSLIDSLPFSLTWQQTLINSSVLTQPNAIALGQNGFAMNGGISPSQMFQLIPLTIGGITSTELRTWDDNVTDGNESYQQNIATDTTAVWYNRTFYNDADPHKTEIYSYSDADEGTIKLTSDTILFKSTLSGTSAGYVWTLADPTTGSGYWGASGGGTETLQQAYDIDPLANPNINIHENQFLIQDSAFSSSIQLNPLNVFSASVSSLSGNNFGSYNLDIRPGFDPSFQITIQDSLARASGIQATVGNLFFSTTGIIAFTNYGLGTHTGTPVFGLSVDASGNIIEIGNLGTFTHNISTPSTGGTVNLTNNQYNIINPAGALLALTINLPSSPANNDVVYIKYTQAITTVTYGNGTVVDGITSPIAGGLVVLVFNSGDSKWY